MAPRLACLIAAAVTTAALLSAQTPTPSATYKLYMLGREIGRETDVVTVTGNARQIESAVKYRQGSTDGEITATLVTALDSTPQRLTVKGRPDSESVLDLDISIEGRRALIRDRGVSSEMPLATPASVVFAGGVPAFFQEQLIRYWRVQGRPREIAAVPGGALRIQTRATEQFDVNGRFTLLERLAIDGPVWGEQTAWLDAAGSLDGLVTSIQGRQVALVREGFETRLPRFIEQHTADRVADLERISAITLSEYPLGVVFTGLTIPPEGKRPAISDGVLVIRGDRIQAVGPAARTKPPGDLPKVDATGLTALPGFWDLHAQIAHPPQLAAYLASGVTTVVNSAADQTFLTQAREADTNGRFIGPRVLQAGFIDGPNALAARASSLDDARQLVRRYRNDGAKTVALGRDVSGAMLRGIAQDAHRLFMTIAGPIPSDLAADQAIDAGLDVFQIGDADASAQGPAIIAAALKRKAAFEPMLAWRELLFRPPATPLGALDAAIKTLPGGLVQSLGAVSSSTASHSIEALVSAAAKAGVPIVAGTGSSIAASTVQREIELLVQAGLTPQQALQAATSGAAQAARVDDSGAIEAGKRADVLLVAGNPLENISSIRNIKWVIANGKVYDPAKLRKAAGFTD